MKNFHLETLAVHAGQEKPESDTFNNDGKDVTIGTLIDKAVITGSGRTTAKRLVLDLSKMKGIDKSKVVSSHNRSLVVF